MSLHLPHRLPHPHVDPDALSMWGWLALSGACILVTAVAAYGLTACMAATP